MKITDIIKSDKPSLSFEVFPPKSDASFESVREATQEIASLSPSFMSVTYGAGGSTSDFTVSIASNIQNNMGVNTLAHLTCVKADKQTIFNTLDTLKANNIENILALRGDMNNPLWQQHESVMSAYYRTQLILVKLAYLKGAEDREQMLR